MILDSLILVDLCNSPIVDSDLTTVKMSLSLRSRGLLGTVRQRIIWRERERERNANQMRRVDPSIPTVPKHLFSLKGWGLHEERKRERKKELITASK